MAKHDLTLLGGLVARKHVSFDDAKALTEFMDHVDVQCVLPINLETAVDLALDFFNDAPDEEAARVSESLQVAAQVSHDDHGVCPDCGEPSMMDDDDFEQSIDLWVAVRGMIDKYAFDQAVGQRRGGEIEEC